MSDLRAGDPDDGRGFVVVATEDDAAWASACADGLATQGYAATVLTLDAAMADRDATARLHAAVDVLVEAPDVRDDGRTVLGVGRGATWALLAGCERSRIDGLVLVDPAPVYADLDAAHPVQPLEMLLNLDAPMLCVYRGSAVPEEERRPLHERAAAFARSIETLTLPSAPVDGPFPLPEHEVALRGFLDDYLP